MIERAMADMLVNLLLVESSEPLLARLRERNINIRRANPWELSRVREFASQWSPAWGDEVAVGFSRQPIAVFIAVMDGEIAGFCAHESSCRDYLGPIGVSEALRGQGIGKGLLLASLHAMRELGYAYAIIGAVGPTEFYAKNCGAVPIDNSGRGIYVNQLKKR
jgi:GNAT superfamily N-acetyltransferase